MIAMPGKTHSGPLPPMTDEERRVRDNLEKTVRALAEEIGERNTIHYDALEKSADYIRLSFEELGYEARTQEFQAAGRTVRNIEAELAGGGANKDEIVVLGAHYDSAPGTPGANDNASGVAGLFELARLLKERELSRTVRFVAFVNEEPPFFQTDGMGSVRYARRCRERGEKIVGMLSLETIGYYSDLKGSQQYPPVFKWFYPDTGDFIGFVANVGSRKLARRCVGAFRRETAFPSEGVAAPGWITGIGWSDHWAFWREGYPALMVTDTAPFRYPHYHAPTDTPDRLDYDRTARVVTGLARVVVELTEK